MPGGRLTQHDRELIASGLAGQLGYAEIARQLDRPTSTISREVARNGGPRGYRADHAQQATGQRAHRRKPAAPWQPSASADASGRDTEAVRDFAEQFAALMVQTGVPRMPARVLAQLFTTDAGSRTAAELAQHLRVSPASVSKAISYLEALSLIRRERQPRQRHEQYVIDDNVWFRAWTTSATKQTMWADAAQRGADLLHRTTPAGARLDSMSRFFARLGDEMGGGPAVDDALTVLAALVHANLPLTDDQLATALGWPSHRVANAIHDAEQHPDFTGPVTLHRTASGTYTIIAKHDRLTATQRQALNRFSPQA